MYIGAHPDDENTAVLAYLVKGKKYRTAYLSLTRGDGGQNLIGSEKGVEIGIIRTQELLEARNIDGAEQYFTRAIDFGYSKTAEETFNFWDRGKVLADMVWVIRTFCPDLIMTRFPPGQSGGHGHHAASALLALQAFKAAADPAQFPEQLKFVKPWKTRRIFANTFRIEQGDKNPLIRVNVGEYNPLPGKSYTEIAALSRSMHKTQGFGAAGRRGIQYDNFVLVDGDPASNDLFEGIDTTWNRIPGGQRTGKMLQKILKTFDPQNPSKSVPDLLAVYEELNKLQENEWVAVKRQELLKIIQSCAGLWIEAVSTGFSAVPGEQVPFRITMVNRSDLPLKLGKVSCPECGFTSLENRDLADNVPVTVENTLHIPAACPISQPYWLEEPFSEGMFSVSNQRMIGLAENPPSIRILVTVSCGGLFLEYPAPLIFRWTDRVDGELYRPFEIRPPATCNFNENVCVFGNNSSKKITVGIKSHASNISGLLRLSGTDSWKVEPKTIPFSIAEKNGEQQVTFTLSPPENFGEAVLVAQAEINGKTYDRALVEISHPHIKKQVYFPQSSIKTVKLDSPMPGGKIGYVMGSGDEIPGALHSLGYDVALMVDEMLAAGDFSSFDAIITGVRAYNTREILKATQSRLLEYVRNGGTVIVQYNVPSGLLMGNFGPYPFTIGNDRVSVETAPVSFIKPDHPLLQVPNRITAADFDGWVQERGLYFATQWDEHYEPVLSCHDPNEPDRKGGMLYARYGKGVFIYSGYAWFRQLPAGVPGAYRLFVNMISSGKNQ
ncbi:MAG: PIG-L family deacetylase [Candidatus Latescibacter sp.]|nr:PIG-L family deacetylase [Candidatus Latescibacter sp.]